MSQAEHDARRRRAGDGQPPSAEAVQNEVERQLTDLPRRDIAQSP
ncbi:MAG: hypothetical protein ACLTYN_05055 [Dysosmobacter welbionis]